MTKSELIARIAVAHPHLELAEAKRAVDTVFDEITKALIKGDRIELRGFGAFRVKTRRARVGRNPRTGETVAVKEKRTPNFKAGKGLRLRINGRT